MIRPTEPRVGATIASVASIVLGVLAAVTALYGFSQDPLGTELYNRLKIAGGDAGPLILTGTVVAIGVVCAIVGLRGGQRWSAIVGIVVNAVALLIAVLLKLAGEHSFGA